MAIFASKYDSHVKRFRKDLVLAAPTPQMIAQAIASIDTDAETAVTSDIIDHHTQLSSWNAYDSEAVIEQSALTDDLGIEITHALESSESVSGGVSGVPSINDSTDIETAAGGTSLSISGNEGSNEVITLDEMINFQSSPNVDRTVYDISEQLTTREQFETAKTETVTGKDNIQRTLKKVRSQMVTKRVAGLLLATNIDPAFINREIHAGSKYNVYALGKLADLVFGMTGGAVSNAINLAILKSLFSLRETDIVFTGEVAKACCSRQWKIDGRTASKLTRHTVSTSTAPTQASSTMSALATLGVVRVEGSSRNPTYILQDTAREHLQ